MHEAEMHPSQYSACPKCGGPAGHGYGLAGGGFGPYAFCEADNCDWFLKTEDAPTQGRPTPQIPLARSVPVVVATLVTTVDSYGQPTVIGERTHGIVIDSAMDEDGDVWVSLDGQEEILPMPAADLRVDLTDPQGIAWAIRVAHSSLDGRDITRILDEWCRAQGPLTDQSWDALAKAMEAHRV